MESTPCPLTHYITYSKVLKVEERKRKRWVSGVGAEAKFEDETRGWFVWLEGSFEAIHLGFDKPELQVGDRVKITIAKEQA